MQFMSIFALNCHKVPYGQNYVSIIELNEDC